MLVIVGLILADLRFNRLDTTRAVLDTMMSPVYWLADIPSRIGNWTDEHIRSRSQLLEDNERLQRENLVLQGRSQRMASLQAENLRLHSLAPQPTRCPSARVNSTPRSAIQMQLPCASWQKPPLVNTRLANQPAVDTRKD